jgi:U5 small nuclear ribonucleoprotein component
MTTEPLDKGLAERIQQGLLFKSESKSVLSDLLVNDFGWDELTASAVWAFGPAQTGSNMLLDYTLEDEVNQNLLSNCRNSIVQGF